jgi:hypothetical protein
VDLLLGQLLAMKALRLSRARCRLAMSAGATCCRGSSFRSTDAWSPQLHTVKASRKFAPASPQLSHGFHDRLRRYSCTSAAERCIKRAYSVASTSAKRCTACFVTLQFIAVGLNFNDGGDNVVHVPALAE